MVIRGCLAVRFDYVERDQVAGVAIIGGRLVLRGIVRYSGRTVALDRLPLLAGRRPTYDKHWTEQPVAGRN